MNKKNLIIQEDNISSTWRIAKKLQLPSYLQVTQSFLKAILIIFLSSIAFSLIDAVVRPIARIMLG